MNQGGLGQLMQQGNLQGQRPGMGGSPFQPGGIAQQFLRPSQSPLMGGQGPQMGIGQGMPPQGQPGMMYGGGSPTFRENAHMGFMPR